MTLTVLKSAAGPFRALSGAQGENHPASSARPHPRTRGPFPHLSSISAPSAGAPSGAPLPPSSTLKDPVVTLGPTR